uniref:Microtubule associated scaffold protein 1 n=1 Tax=Paramormyrops kingsleyae TaxID=1676925 RepID=A0A3B3QR90_9TELE|nr:microtubule-associated tumor suppressor 1 [Paramormyrops kingsleyae]XP_023686498.1 microtubule-associated tumor suppressor 1 [Paramormyrops kingsleyae]XP_023686499.1 microtubule-associated tumor suppressor 1 [Paramormyrops kingsleyae]
MSQVPCRGLYLPLSPGNPNCDAASCEESDSLKSISSLSESILTSPLDAETLECEEGAGLGSAALSSGPRVPWKSNITFLKTDLEACNGNQIHVLQFDRPGHAEGSPQCPLDHVLNEEAGTRADTCNKSSGEVHGDSAMSTSSEDMVMRRSGQSLSDSGKQLSDSLLGRSTCCPARAPHMGTSSATPDICEGLLHKTHICDVHKDLETGARQESRDGRLRRGSPANKHPSKMSFENKEDGDLALDAASCSSQPHGSLSDILFGETFVFFDSNSDSSCNAQTSTPVLGSSNKTFCIPPFECRSHISQAGSSSPALGPRGPQRGTPPNPARGSRVPGPAQGGLARLDSRRFPKLPDLEVAKLRMTAKPVPAGPPSSVSVKAAAAVSVTGPKKPPPASSAGAGQSSAGGPDRGKRRRSSSSQNTAFPRKADEAPATKSKRGAASSPRGSGRGPRKEVGQAVSDRNPVRRTSVVSTDASGGSWSPSRSKAVSARGLQAPHPSPSGARARPRPGGTPARERPSVGGGLRLPVGSTALPTGTPKMRLMERVGVAVASKLSTNPGTGPARPTSSSSRLPLKGPPKSPSFSSQTSNRGPQPLVASSQSPAPRPDERAPCPGITKGAFSPRAGTKPLIAKPIFRRNATPVLQTAAGPSALPPRPATSPMPRTNSTRTQHPPTPTQVDRSRLRSALRSPRVQGQPNPPLAQPKLSGPRLAPQLQQRLQQQLGSVTRVMEALTVVVQHISAQHEEDLKQKRQLSMELMDLRVELGTRTSLCERLQQEKEEVRVTLEGALKEAREQYECELAGQKRQLEELFNVQCEEQTRAYQEALDRYQGLMQQEIEAQKSRMEASHGEAVEKFTQHYEAVLEEDRRTHQEDMQVLSQTLREQIECLMVENNDLNEKLKAQEDRRRKLAEKNQKDSHTMYLEQELESLKVVLDIKNKQLHQQERKVMQMDKLVEANVKLEESLKKAQQENEDYRVRMDKHAALSRQLSTEQAVLQQILQKESSVNKRLSMENEELLWKLQNGDLGSPHKRSPSSPLQSPHSSMLSPR